MRKRNFRFTALFTMLCVMLTMSFTTVGFAESNTDIRLVTPDTSIHGLPDNVQNLSSPVDSSVQRKCKVSSATLQTLAERTYMAGENEFYINAAYSTK